MLLAVIIIAVSIIDFFLNIIIEKYNFFMLKNLYCAIFGFGIVNYIIV